MKPLVRIALVLTVTAIATVVAYFAGAEEVAVMRALAIGLLTLLVVGGGTYLVIYTIRMKQLEIPAEEMGDEEVVWAKTTHTVHYKSGNTFKFWEAVGGKLFLTNEVLEFRANPAEWWVYRIKIPLLDIRRASPCKIGLFPGGLRVEREDGTFELFTFGSAFDVSREWADAIMEFGDDIAEEERGH
jgi:hypothetical protein